MINDMEQRCQRWIESFIGGQIRLDHDAPELFFAKQASKLTGTSGGVLGHIAHVGNLLEALLALHLGGTLTVLGLLLDLSTLDVGFVELVAKAAVVGTGILGLGAILVVLDRLASAEGVRVALVLEESRGLHVCGSKISPKDKQGHYI